MTPLKHPTAATWAALLVAIGGALGTLALPASDHVLAVYVAIGGAVMTAIGHSITNPAPAVVVPDVEAIVARVVAALPPATAARIEPVVAAAEEIAPAPFSSAP